MSMMSGLEGMSIDSGPDDDFDDFSSTKDPHHLREN
jgi:hypothetical protein